MFKKIAVFFAIFLVGCGNLSPRINPDLRQQIDNQQGRIDEIENNQNSIKNELIRINNNQITNSGIQILSGNGGIIVGMTGIGLLLVIILHYRHQYILADKLADMLAASIVRHQNPILEEDVFQAAMYTDVEKKLLELVKKHQNSI